jgi:hypothetical protein
MPLAKDIWRPLIVDAPIAEVLRYGSIEGFPHRWLPEQSFLRFLADPFGIDADGWRTLFVERYDYRSRHGVIDALSLDEAGRVVEQREVLAEPWHLSYPFVFRAEQTYWMLPEAYRSGRLTLYRAVEYPWIWEPAGEIALDRVAVDATPFFHDGLWWLFHAAADDEASKTGALFVAWAERLTGPWHAHRNHPVRRGFADCRPGGTPVVIDGQPVLPVQDCSRTYGGAIRPLRIHRLTPDHFEAEAGPPIMAPPSFAPFDQGLHTLSAFGGRTLVDVKRRLLTPRSLAVLATRGRRRG